MATKKITIEVEVPDETIIGDKELEVMRSAAKRALIYLILEKAQKREPTQEEINKLAEEAKKNIYRKIKEAGD